MYALPDFDNFKTPNAGLMNGECSKPKAASFQYPPPSSSPFLTLGSGFSEKPYESKMATHEQNYRPYSSNYIKPRPTPFVRDPNKYKFSCDTCNRLFLFQSHLDKHLAQHVKCDIEDCSFEGHEKVVAMHQKTLHFSGMASLILGLNTPEEIKRWREERKKNYPTAANIEKRQNAQAAKRARGEIVDEKPFQKTKRRRHMRVSLNKDKFNQNNDSLNDQNRDNLNPNKDKRPFAKWKPRRRRMRRKPQSSENDTKNVNFPPQKQSNFNDHSVQKPGISANQIPLTAPSDKLIMFPGTRFIEMNEQMESTKHNDMKDDLNNFTDSDVECLGEHCVKDSDKVTFIISDSEIEDTYATPASQSSKNESSVLPISINAVNERSEQTASSIYKVENSVECCTTTNTPALSFFTADNEFEDSEDEAPAVQKVVKSEPPANPSLHVKVGNALGSLMAAYDTESECESKNETVTKPTKVQPVKRPDSDKKPSIGISSTRNNVQARPHVSHRKLTLLEKLLASEIRHERNVIFQCITYILKNNFFDKSD